MSSYYLNVNGVTRISVTSDTSAWSLIVRVKRGFMYVCIHNNTMSHEIHHCNVFTIIALGRGIVTTLYFDYAK